MPFFFVMLSIGLGFGMMLIVGEYAGEFIEEFDEEKPKRIKTKKIKIQITTFDDKNIKGYILCQERKRIL